jgi:hypothetical protein
LVLISAIACAVSSTGGDVVAPGIPPADVDVDVDVGGIVEARGTPGAVSCATFDPGPTPGCVKAPRWRAPISSSRRVANLVWISTWLNPLSNSAARPQSPDVRADCTDDS